MLEGPPSRGWRAHASAVDGPRADSACGWNYGSGFRSVRSGEDGAGRSGNSVPNFLPGVGGREVKDDSSDGLLDPGTDLQELLAEGSDLSASERGPSSAKSKFLEEDERRGRLEDAELVGEEPGAARPVDFEPEQQLLDPVLDFPATAVEVVDLL